DEPPPPAPAQPNATSPSNPPNNACSMAIRSRPARVMGVADATAIQQRLLDGYQIETWCHRGDLPRLRDPTTPARWLSERDKESEDT
ncbi:MAG TPA: hypothetical protein VM487_06200, partial [Phycisphaerae bacterium]|nr:hypothetical protein [Phycisphaerae bacterium]